jgi:two-component system, chemotaxis family, sensor kinase CheA
MSSELSKTNKDLYILIVDDEKDLLQVVGKMVDAFGFQPLTATSGTEAIKLVEKFEKKIALILCDFNMPGTNGFELRTSLLEKWKQIPFVIISAYVSREDALKAVDLKISAFLPKPVDLNVLQACVIKESKERVLAIREEEDLLKGFIDEATGNIEALEPLVLELESHPNELELVNRIFGLVHTLKGASGYFQPLTLHRFVHKFEDLLSKIKSGAVPVTSDVISIILQSITILSKLVGELKSGEHLTTNLDELTAILNINNKDLTKIISSSKQGTEPPSNAAAIEAKKDLRVSVDLLDEFMQISGEMTVARNMINKLVRSIEKTFPGNKDVSLLAELVDETHKINGAIQSKIVELRKMPIKSIIKSYPRLIRDLSTKLGKDVELCSQGDDLRVDTSVADVLSKSLIHMLRNSIDHGLETPEDRVKQNKPKKGKINIAARISGDDVIVEVSDDGRGILASKIKEKLLKNGMTKNQVEAMSEHRLLMQLFEPGFSTAVVVTEVSGRGVGMDVVKKSVESLKGEVSINTEPGKGTKFTLKIPTPRSVHIINSLVVKSGNERFCIPQDDILRILEIPKDQENKLINSLHGMRAIRLFEGLIPLIDFNEILGYDEKQKSDKLKIIVLKSSEGLTFAISVDEIMDVEDTVVKPLPLFLRGIEIFSGATFMGDGMIGLILSTEGLANKFHISSLNDKDTGPQEEEKRVSNKKQEIVLFSLENAPGLFAVPRAHISRFEQWDTNTLQFSGNRWVVPYRGQILQLVRLTELLNFKDPSATFGEEQNGSSILGLIVDDDNGHKVGLLVKSIVDICQIEGEFDDLIKDRRGMSGVLTLPDQTVTVLDVKNLIAV